MALDEKVAAFIGEIYRAGTDDAAWQRVGEGLLKLTSSRFVLISVADLDNDVFASHRFIGRTSSRMGHGETEFAEEYHKRDPTLAYGIKHPHARFCDSRKAVLSPDYLADDFIKWNRDRFGSTHWLVGYTAPENGLANCASLHPDASRGPLSHADDRLFRLLFEHIDQSLRLAARPPSLAHEREPILLLDRKGLVIAMSAAAETLLAQADGIKLSEGRLRTSQSPDQIALDRAIASACAACVDGTSGASIQVERPSRRRPLILRIRPLPPIDAPWSLPNATAIVRIIDPCAYVEGLGGSATIFGFTPREQQVAEELLRGHSLESLAEVLRISRNTARVHLAAVLRKTGTSRQADLIRLLSNLV